MLRATAAPIEGVVELAPGSARVHRTAVLTVTILPLVAVVLAIIAMWPWGVTAVDLSIAGGMYAITTLGITMGYHRLFTHQSFTAPKWLRFLLALFGSLAVQGAIISWVADHRRHHAFSDAEGDPHSPHVGPGGPVRRFWRAHIGWLWRPDKTLPERWAPDVAADPMLQKFEKFWPKISLGSVFLPPLLGLAITGHFRGAFTAFVWGTGVRLFVLHHMSWSINSVSHTFGRRDYKTHDKSRNVWALALISFGESWHNNHHAFPTSAAHGLRWWQFDLTGITIRVMGKLRIVKNVKMPSARQLARLSNA